MSRIYDLLAGTHAFKPSYMVRLNAECQADIEWWATFIIPWNGVLLLHPLQLAAPNKEISSGSWGCRAMWQTSWFQVPLESMPISTESIAAKEFYPIVLAAIIWSHAWHGSSVLYHCDTKTSSTACQPETCCCAITRGACSSSAHVCNSTCRRSTLQVP